MGGKSIIRPSTQAYVREARQTNNFSLFDLVHGYVYSRWIYLYIGMAMGKHPLAKQMAPILNWIKKLIITKASAGNNLNPIKMEDTYHGKVVPLEAAKQLVSIKEDISIGSVEKIIPYQIARDIILKNPDHIAVLDCPCRVVSENPCLPLDVCLIVGEPFASLIVDHHPQKARRITCEEAQEIIKAEDGRGHVHHAFFKDAMLERFYAICNCCRCCCGAMQIQRRGMAMLAPSGYVAQIEQALCLTCGTCEEICPFEAISVNDTTHVDIEKCMGCGICMTHCQEDAITLTHLASKGEPLEIQSLIKQFNQSRNT